MFVSEADIVIEGGAECRNEFFSSLGEHGVPAKDVILVRATFTAGEGHGFHYHEDREEFLYVLEGEVEQWVGEEKRLCLAGDVIYVPDGVVHASFNVGKGEARLLAIFGNKSSDAELAVDVSGEEPWCGMRGC